MKYQILVQICKYLQKYSQIFSILRVDDMLIRICFNKDECVFFDLKKGNSDIFITKDYKRNKIYKAPFDIVLSKRLTNAKIEQIEILDDDRIVKFHTLSQSSYAVYKTILQLELTGRNTNAILLDENNIILEALRHIDLQTSSRAVMVGGFLENLPNSNFVRKDSEKIENIKEYLEQNYIKKQEEKLKIAKKQKRELLDKKIQKLQSSLKLILSEESLYEKAEILSKEANLIFANLDKIKPYDKQILLKDFEEKEVKIIFPDDFINPKIYASSLFENAKKLRQRAKNSHIQRENLEDKIKFYLNLDSLLKDAKDINSLEILLPKQKQQKFKEKENANYESFFIEGHKILVGKSEKGNIELLKDAKKNDIWLHLKDIASAHVIIKTMKQSVPEAVLVFGANLCVYFSGVKKGGFLVDYTQRRNVKIVSGARVNYVEYKTLHIQKE